MKRVSLRDKAERLIECHTAKLVIWPQMICHSLRSWLSWLWFAEIKHIILIGWDQTHDCDWLTPNTVVNHGTQTRNLFPVGNYVFKVNFEQVNAGRIDHLMKLIVLIDTVRFPFRNEGRNLSWLKLAWNFWVLQNCLRLLRFDWSTDGAASKIFIDSPSFTKVHPIL